MIINTVESPMDLPLKIQHLSSKEWDTVENTLMDLTTSFMDFNWSTKLYILNTILKKTIINWPNISLERQKTLIYPLFLSKCNHEVLLNVFDHAKTKHSDISLFILKLYLDSFTLHDILQCIYSECKSTLARQGNWNNAVHIFTSISDLFPFHFVRSIYYEKIGNELSTLISNNLFIQETTILVERMLSRGLADLLLESWQKSNSVASIFPVLIPKLNPLHLESILTKWITSIEHRENAHKFSSSVHFADFLEKNIGQITFSDCKALQSYLNLKWLYITDLEPLTADALCILTKHVPHNLEGSIVKVYEGLFTLWCNNVVVSTSSEDFHIIIAVSLLSCSREIRELGISLDRRLFQDFLISGIPNYLKASRANVRTLGLLVAECLSKELVISGVDKLEFDLHDRQFDWIRSIIEIPLHNSSPQIRNEVDLVKETAKEDADEEMPWKLVEETDECTDSESESEIEMVNNIQPILPRLANELTPKYISQAIALIKSNEPDKIEVALKHLEGLFTKASRLELEENSKAICSLLISLENEFELENFTTMHCSAFVVLCLREQKFTSQIMCQSLFLKDIPMICRLNILRIFLAVVMTCDENSTVGWTVSCTNISTLYTTTMLNLLEINKNWNFLFEDSFNFELGRRVIYTLSTLLYYSGVDKKVHNNQRFGELLLSLKWVYHHFAFEIMRGILIYISNLSSVEFVLYGADQKEKLISFSKVISSSSSDKKVNELFNQINGLC